MKTLCLFLLLAFAAFAVVFLAAGPTLLGMPLPGGLPVGNALAAEGLCALAGAALTMSCESRPLRSVSLAALVSAVAWLPSSILLAGNLRLNFNGIRGLVWLALSMTIVVGVFVVLVSSIVYRWRTASAR